MLFSKRNTKIASLICALSLFTALISGCAPKEALPTPAPASPGAITPAPAPAKKTVFKLGHVSPNTDAMNDAALKIAEKVGKLTNGELEIQVYPNSEIGSNKDNLEQASRGANIITIVDPGYMADYVPDYGIMNGPFLFKTWEDIKVLSDSDWHTDMKNQSSQKGIKVLGSGLFYGNRHIISGKTITTPADTKGLKIRVPSNTMWIETMKAMGANPTTLQWSEVYSGLSQGVVEAAEAPLATLYSSKLHEAKKNIALTGHFTAVTIIATSQKIFDTLSDDNKKALETAVEEEGAVYSEINASSEQDWIKKLEAEGVKFNEVDQESFRAACEATYKAFPDWSPNLLDTVQKALGYK